MRFPSHRTALHSWWTVNLTGGTDGDTVREVQQSFPVRCSPEDSQVSPLHTVGVSGHCTGPVFLHSCLWVVHAHGCPLPFEIIGVFNFLFPVKGNRAFRTFVGPKTMGPQRRTGKHFEIQIYFCSPQMTTFLFENVWLSCSLRTQWVAALSMWQQHPNQGGFLQEGVEMKVFCSPRYQSVLRQLSGEVCVWKKGFGSCRTTEPRGWGSLGLILWGRNNPCGEADHAATYRNQGHVYFYISVVLKL